jgi:P4 family phage/plasmid primase-like protien
MPPIEESPLEKLAALAPKEEKTTQTPWPIRKGSPGGAQTSDLGRLHVDRYLDHYGIGYSVKQKGDVTIYALERCVFDSGHTKNEAAINQASNGLLTYKCFHNSCQGKYWTDARKIISGDNSIAQFHEEYDPNWTPPRKRGRPRKTDPQDETVPPGDEKQFLIVNEKSGKAKFIPARMANYLEDQLKPIIFEGKHFSDLFYKYDPSGVWKVYPKDSVAKIVRDELEDYATKGWVEGSVDLLGTQTFTLPEKLVYDPMWLNLVNGMLNVETREMRPHSPSFQSRVQMSVKYKEDAMCPQWIEALAEIFSDNVEKAAVLQEFFGYCLYPKILFPAALFQIGKGRNGKGVVEKILCAMLGKANVSHISMARMQESFGPVEIREKLLNSCGETETKPLDVTNFKGIAAGDEFQAEVKYKSDVKFEPIAKHMISMNSFPGIKEKTDAFFFRIIVLEYNQRFEGDDADTRLADKLLGELDGIFKWALDGLKIVLENESISSPEVVTKAKERFKEKANPVLNFVTEACVLEKEGKQGKQGGIRVLPADLYRKYVKWMEEARSRQALGKQNFYEQIYLNYPNVKKLRETGGTRVFFFGIGLRSSGDDE